MGAYEASNLYDYRPLNLAEKIMNCRQAIDVRAGEGESVGSQARTRGPGPPIA